MNIERIREKLIELFGNYRVVFWNDANADFNDDLSECLPQGVEIVRPDVIGQFKTKVMLEIEKTQNKFLVYSALPEPQPEDDWLLDIRMYCHQFRADLASMFVEELGLQHYQLRGHIDKRKKFFANKQRLAKLKDIISSNDTEKDIDRKILAVLVKAKNDRFFDIIHAVYSAYPLDEGLDFIPEPFNAVQKMDMEEIFWDFAWDVFGYKAEKPSLRHLATFLFVSDLYLSLGDSLCRNVRQFILPSGFVRDAAVCLSEWRDSVKMAENYDRLSIMIADALGIERFLNEAPLNTQEEIIAIIDSVTFYDIEKICAVGIKSYILGHELTLDKDFAVSFCRHRQALHWSNKRLSSETVPRKSFWAVYEALIAAAEFMSKKTDYPQGFIYTSAKEIFTAYVSELFMFDRYYRIFHEHAGAADAQGWDILKDIKLRMEDLYNNWFLEPLMVLWEEKIQLNRWRIEGVNNQYDFYDKYPRRKIGDKNATVFVIISDALRYEAGAEIAEQLNGKYRFEAKKEAMLGCVPSCTALGMAALLPHSKLAYSSNGDVLVDGKMCSSTAYRSEILDRQRGFAIKSNEFLRMTRNEARERLREKNIVYLYHNTIDKEGEDANSEEKTFSAVRTAIDEICEIVSSAVNNLNARYVYITADHGFVYTEDYPGEIKRNKVELSDKGFVPIKKNKRYSLGKNIPVLDFVHQEMVSNTSGVIPEDDMQFAIPKGMSLFYFTGGARFFHGGVSLQEIVVPVITVEQIRGKDQEKTRDKAVGVQVLGQDHRITTGKHRFEILQIDAVSERFKPAIFKIGIYADNEPVSDIQTVSFESATQEIADRKKDVVLTLKNIDFASQKTYRLVLRNADTDIEEQAMPVRIDRIFTGDF